MYPKLLLRLAALALAFLCARAPAQHLPLKAYGQAEGLGNLSVTVASQDTAGYVWIGTQNGLFRFNGTGFRRYGPAQGFPDQIVTALVDGRATGMWAGTYENLYRFDGRRFRPVRFDGKPLEVWPGQPLAATADGRVLVCPADNGERSSLSSYTFRGSIPPDFQPYWMRSDLERVCSPYEDRSDCPHALIGQANGGYGLSLVRHETSRDGLILFLLTCAKHAACRPNDRRPCGDRANRSGPYWKR